MLNVVTATEAKNQFGKILRTAYMGGPPAVIKRGGIPVGAFVSMSHLRQLIDLKKLSLEENNLITAGQEQEQARQDLAEFLQTVHKRLPDIPEAEIEQDIQEAIRAVRNQA